MIFIDDKVYCDFSSDGYRLPTNREWLFAHWVDLNQKVISIQGVIKQRMLLGIIKDILIQLNKKDQTI